MLISTESKSPITTDGVIFNSEANLYPLSIHIIFLAFCNMSIIILFLGFLPLAINTDGEQLRTFDQFNLAKRVIANSNQIEKVHFSNKDLEPIQTIIASLDDTEMGWPNQVLFYQPELESFLREKIKTFTV